MEMPKPGYYGHIVLLWLYRHTVAVQVLPSDASDWGLEQVGLPPSDGSFLDHEVALGPQDRDLGGTSRITPPDEVFLDHVTSHIPRFMSGW